MLVQRWHGAGTASSRGAAAAPVLLRSLDLSDRRWDLAAEAACLSDAERARADQGVPAVRRRRILVRAGLRRVLGGVLGTAPADVPLRTDGGRPFLPGDRLRFSCSASGDVALLAVTRGCPVGVDVQHHRDEDVRAAAGEGWLADEELARIAGLSAGERPAVVTRARTQKEAVLKARGTGVRRPPVDVVTPVTERGWIGALHLSPVPVPSGYVASLAAGVPVDPDLVDPVALSPGGCG
ncbi:4-phosphopantetheinyl transferase [Geodermatophilus sp. TF02-6]|uniref:4'-phosphopantetheinyl transferase family protein n=1 Tax=Geodermatophilus sp. TF02-6 TaxID=2250575 RepID=UPI000DEB1C9F|nr:4'-phosphopantetheinyl transferase superfamily protein [Geodermatophilus sp. TF02-6]RBY75298.1 4-phosphopantetheinyl transferase [Geodermatophilus sp. TF02-6]